MKEVKPKRVKPIKRKKMLAQKLEGRMITRVMILHPGYLQLELDDGNLLDVGADLVGPYPLPILTIYVAPPGSEPA